MSADAVPIHSSRFLTYLMEACVTPITNQSVFIGESILRTGSFGDTLLRSLEYLGFKARSHNAAAACDTVSRLLAEQQKYESFKDMFPDEWTRSKTSLYRAGNYKKYSERVNELFELVNKKCFPLLDYWNDDPDFEFEQFVIMPLNFDLCCEEIDFDSLRVSYVAGLLFYFGDDEVWGFFSEKYHLSARDFPEIARSPHPNVWLKKQNASAKPYSELIKLVDHSTGNPWLDISHCQYQESFEWSKETIQFLTQAHRDAGKAFTNLERLDEKIGKNPRQVLFELISFWNNGCLDAG